MGFPKEEAQAPESPKSPEKKPEVKPIVKEGCAKLPGTSHASSLWKKKR